MIVEEITPDSVSINYTNQYHKILQVGMAWWTHSGQD